MILRSPLFAIAALVSLSVASALAPGAAAQSVVVTSDQRSDLALTVYEGGFALIQDARQANLPQGRAAVILSDLSEQLDTATIRLSAGDGIQVENLSFERETLSTEALLRRALGKTVRVARVNPATGEETFETAEVLSVAPEVVLRIGERIETRVPGRIVFDGVPDDLRPTPGIAATLNSERAGAPALLLSYLSDGISWKTSYVGRLSTDGRRLALTAWAQIDNQTATAYPDTRLSLISGEVNRAVAKRPPFQPVATAARGLAAAEMVADGVTQTAAGPFYRYAFDQTFDIRARQQTQVPLFRSTTVPVTHTLRSEGGPLFNIRSATASQPVMARLTITNDEANGLGLPLPAGLFSAFAVIDGREVFQGGARVDATPVGKDMEVDLGRSFDVTFERTVVEFDRTGPRNQLVDTTQRLVVKNGGDTDVLVEVVEGFQGDWQIIRESAPHSQLSAFQAMWEVTVPARGSAEIEYRAQIGPR